IVEDFFAPAGWQLGLEVISDFLAKILFFLGPLPFHHLPSPCEGIRLPANLRDRLEDRLAMALGFRAHRHCHLAPRRVASVAICLDKVKNFGALSIPG